MAPRIRTALLVLAAVLFALYVWPTPWVYYVHGVERRRHRLTGEVQVFTGGHWRRR